MITRKVRKNDWVRADEESFSVIGLLIGDDQSVHIRNETSALGAWGKLKHFHEKATLSNKVHLMRTICSLKMEEMANISNHINIMQELFIQLRTISDDELTEAWGVAMLLSSLPRNYDTLITALEARDEKELTFGFVQQKLISEYERHHHGDEDIESGQILLKAVRKEKSTKDVTCFFCKKKIHIKKNCFEYKKWLGKQKSGNSNAHNYKVST